MPWISGFALRLKIPALSAPSANSLTFSCSSCFDIDHSPASPAGDRHQTGTHTGSSRRIRPDGFCDGDQALADRRAQDALFEEGADRKNAAIEQTHRRQVKFTPFSHTEHPPPSRIANQV